MADKELFVPTRDTVATPPPGGKRKKPKLTADQNIYLAKKQVSSFSLNLVSLVLILGLCFVILYPFLQLVPTVLSALEDLGNPNVIWIPEEWSTLSFQAAARMTMPEGFMTMVKSIGFALLLMVIQVFVSAMTGYTMARVKYKWGTPLMFVLVVLAFLVPRQSLLLAQYIYFSNFDAMGVMDLLHAISPSIADEINLIGNPVALYVMALLGFGVNQSLMILIFSQFFKNIPKELEEAALIDGCGFYRTYFKIMVPNAIPAIVIVAILSFVWNYGDTYYTRYFDPEGAHLASELATTFIDANKQTLLTRVQTWYSVPVTTDMTFDALKQAGVLIFLVPLVLLYLFAQRWLVENLENSGLVG
ncbi:MAG: carbohydrate ABC transporter permease [Clostridia bacterium]|nr:carbohydrate ABC transporter permease [Clostridia bacterium]